MFRFLFRCKLFSAETGGRANISEARLWERSTRRGRAVRANAEEHFSTLECPSVSASEGYASFVSVVANLIKMTYANRLFWSRRGC